MFPIENEQKRFKPIHVYTYDIQIIMKGYWSYRLEILALALKNKKKMDLNATLKDFFGETNTEYPGFVVTHHGVQPIHNKAKATTDMKYTMEK